MRANECQRCRVDITLCLEYVDNYENEWEDKCDKCDDQNYHHDRMGNFFISRSLYIICHYAATSPFLPM